jgi:anti-anti-sigma factor
MAQVIHQQDVTIVELDASYESIALDPLEQLGDLLFGEIAAMSPPRLVLDMTNTRYIDSMFIETVFRAWKRIQERKGKMALCCANEMCAQVLTITNLNKLWPVCATREEAIRVARG